MNAGRLLALTRNFANCNLHNGYYLRFHHSNYSSRALCKFLLVYSKATVFSSSFPFLTVGKTPNDFAEQKHASKTDFSTKNLSYNKYTTPIARSNLTKSQADSIETLHIEKLEYMGQYKGQNETNIMQIEMNQFNSTKWISLIYRLFSICNEFAQISIPDDAYKFVKGMDELMSKVVEQNKPPNSPIFVGVRGGLNYDYGLKILPFRGRLEFRMESITTSVDPWHKPNDLYMPVRLLPLLRDRIAKMLVKFDGTEQIGPPPSPLPKWILESEEDSFQQNIVTSEEDNKEQWEISKEETLDFNVNIMNEKYDRQIKIELQRNKRGDEFIQIVQKFDKLDSSKNVGKDSNKSVYFPPIPMPTDAYRLLDAMHTLSNDLQENCPNLQIPDDMPLGTPICRQIVKNGLLYDYKLKIYISPASKQLDFRLQTITTGAYKFHTPSKLYGTIPIHIFNWLKEKMAELLKSSSSNQHLKLNNVNEKGQIAYREEANKIQEGLIRRETEFYWLETESKPRLMKIELKQGKSGRKYIQIVQQRYEKNIGEGGGDVIFINFPNMLVPDDAYRFIDAMQTMSNELEEKQATLLTGENKSSMVCQKLVKGLNYDYKLEIHLCQNQQLYFRLQTMPNNAYKRHKPKELHGPIPIHMFTWLMEKMAEILDDYEL